MEIYYHAKFLKNYHKRIASSSKLKRLVKKKISLFLKNPFDVVLKNHSLKGKKKGLRSFSVSPDLRIIYQEISKTTIVFLDIGSHNQVY